MEIIFFCVQNIENRHYANCKLVLMEEICYNRKNAKGRVFNAPLLCACSILKVVVLMDSFDARKVYERTGYTGRLPESEKYVFRGIDSDCNVISHS